MAVSTKLNEPNFSFITPLKPVKKFLQETGWGWQLRPGDNILMRLEMEMNRLISLHGHFVSDMGTFYSSYLEDPEDFHTNFGLFTVIMSFYPDHYYSKQTLC